MDNTDKDLVLQFSVKHAQKMDCGGGYIKLIPTSRCPSLSCKLLDWRPCMSWLQTPPGHGSCGPNAPSACKALPNVRAAPHTAPLC